MSAGNWPHLRALKLYLVKLGHHLSRDLAINNYTTRSPCKQKVAQVSSPSRRRKHAAPSPAQWVSSSWHSVYGFSPVERTAGGARGARPHLSVPHCGDRGRHCASVAEITPLTLNRFKQTMFMGTGPRSDVSWIFLESCLSSSDRVVCYWACTAAASFLPRVLKRRYYAPISRLSCMHFTCCATINKQLCHIATKH